MNVTTLNMTTLDGNVIIKKGEGGGATINNQDKSIDITENGTTEVVADNGFTGLSKVSVNVNVKGGGTSGASPGAVTYYDYDGTVLHSFSADAFAALAEHPALPEREGLVCQDWNYDLAKAQEYVAKYGMLNIGANYITDDGKTRLYIRIAAEGRMDVPLHFSQTVANGVTIDWGDGSETQTVSGAGNKNITHKYASIGDYCITLSVANGCTLGLGHNSSSYCVIGSAGNSGKVYCNMLQTVEIGRNVTSFGAYAFNGCRSLASVVIPESVTNIGAYAFSYCYSLASVVIPESVTNIGNSAFSYCYSLASVVIPESVTNIGNSAFSDCPSLASVVIPESVTSIGNSAFNGCYSLASVVIPESVTSIGNSAFYSCYGMAFYDFSALTAMPSLSATNAFQSILSDCKIIVPDALYDEWIAATNWSTYASKIIKKSDWDTLNA